jgi:hypothetical protein
MPDPQCAMRDTKPDPLVRNEQISPRTQVGEASTGTPLRPFRVGLKGHHSIQVSRRATL